MNERERLLALLKGEKPDKLPWFADLSYIYFSLNERGLMEECYKGDTGYLKFHTDLGVGIFVYAPFLWHTEYMGGVKYAQVVEGHMRTSIYDTPLGVITSLEKYTPTTYSWAYVKHFVEDIQDLRVMLYVHENAVHTENYAAFSAVDSLWNGHGIACGISPISAAPIQKLLARWAGVDNTIALYMDHTEEFGVVMRRIEASEDKIFEIMRALDVPYVEFAENLSSEITGKNFFLQYNSPYYQKRIKDLHNAGKYVGIHIDGTLKACLPLLTACGFDVAEAVTPGPVGDVEPEDLRNTAGENIAIWGGLPGALFTPAFDEAEFETYLKRILRIAEEDGRFIIGVADQVPPDGILSRVKKVRELVDNRRY